MPVRYDIAAGVPQQQSGGFDPLNAFATMQAMSYRQQQNALAQMQMQEYQRKLQAEQALRGMAAGQGFNIADPALVGRTFAIDPDEAIKIANLQRQLEALQASAEAQKATTKYHTGMLGLAQAKLPMEQQKLEQEALKERRLGESAKISGEKTALERDAEMLKTAENTAAKILMANGKGYDKWYAGLHDNLKAILPPEYDEQAVDAFTTQMATTQEQIKRRDEYELVDRINPNTGLKEKVAVPKYAPEKGGKAVPGTAGEVQDKFGFMPGPADTGLVTRTNPRTGMAELVTPRQPGANVMAAPETPANAMRVPAPAPAPALTAPGRIIPSEIRPTAEAPVGSEAYNNKRFATEVLDGAGFNSETGEDEVSKLIRKSTSGGMEAGGASFRGFFGSASPGMRNIARLETIKSDVVMKKLKGKLGQGISEGDRQFIEKSVGDIANPNIPSDQRLAAWNQVKSLMVKYANTGQPAAAAAPKAERGKAGEQPKPLEGTINLDDMRD